MKKLILLTIIALLSITANAQYLLTPQGVKVADNPEAGFITADFEGKAAAKLYNATLVQIVKMFVSPKDVISKVENEAITINGVGFIIAKNASGIKSEFKMMFTMSIQFKDNRVRFNNPSIISMRAELGSNELVLQGGSFMGGSVNVFKKKGEVRDVLAKETIEKFFNSIISDIESGIKNSDNVDW